MADLKLGVISDIHGNDAALKCVLEQLEKEQTDGIIFLGDVLAGGPNPKAALELLIRMAPICWITGNTDTAYEEIYKQRMSGQPVTASDYYTYALREVEDDGLAYLLSKPSRYELRMGGVSILCVHGSPRSQLEKLGAEIDLASMRERLDGVGADIVLCGHSHHPSVSNVNGICVVNADSVGAPYDGDGRACYAVVGISSGRFDIRLERADYPKVEILRQAREKDFPRPEIYETVLKRGIYLE